MKMDSTGKTVGGRPSGGMIDVVDRLGNPTGKVVDREKAHRTGFRHRSIHVWLVRKSRTRPGRFEVLLQRRSHSSVSFPGCHDASCAGHIPAGNEWIPFALRKLKRELGVEAQPRDLFFVGKQTISSHGYFHGRRFVDREVRVVYFLWCDRDEDASSRYHDKGSSFRWMEMGDLRKRLGTRSFPNCISETEVDWLLRHPAIFPVTKAANVRFSVEHGPASLFERVRHIISPSMYADFTIRLHKRRLDRVVPDLYRTFSDLAHNPAAWVLVAAETRRNVGKFVRSHWNVHWRDRWYRLVLDSQGCLSNFKELPDGDAHFVRVVRAGPDYEFAERVNRALMDVTKGRETQYDTDRIKGLMN